MDDRDPDRADASRVIAEILAAAYLRLRFPEYPSPEVDCAENTRPDVTGS